MKEEKVFDTDGDRRAETYQPRKRGTRALTDVSKQALIPGYPQTASVVKEEEIV
jgi:hypothetical protein